MVEILLNKQECLRCSHKWIPRTQIVIVCPNCKSPYWDKLRTVQIKVPKFKSALNTCERKAYFYLLSKGINIDYEKSKLHYSPDFIDKDGKGYEIKKIAQNRYSKFIRFEKLQWQNFKDDVQVLIFEPFQDKPSFEFTMQQLRNSKPSEICISIK